MRKSRLKINLQTIDIPKIERNPDNPRGDYVRDKDINFDYLKRSIRQYGLLVPLVVQRRKNGKFRLIDGERRFNALKELGIKKAPAHVIAGSVVPDESKNVMFHIHTTRLQWDPIEQCRALTPLYEKLKRHYKDNENDIARDMIRLTGTNARTVKSRLLFLCWPKNMKKIAYNKEPELYWPIVEIEQGIIRPALKNFPDYFVKVPVNEARKLLLKKYLQETVHAGTEARKLKNILKTTPEHPTKYRYARVILNKVVKNYKYTFNEASEDFAAEFPEEGLDTITFEILRRKSRNFLSSLRQYDAVILEGLSRTKRNNYIQMATEINDILSGILSDFEEDE